MFVIAWPCIGGIVVLVSFITGSMVVLGTSVSSNSGNSFISWVDCSCDMISCVGSLVCIFSWIGVSCCCKSWFSNSSSSSSILASSASIFPSNLFIVNWSMTGEVSWTTGSVVCSVVVSCACVSS